MEPAVLLQNLQDEFSKADIKPNRLIISEDLLEPLAHQFPYLFSYTDDGLSFISINPLTKNTEELIILKTTRQNYIGLAFVLDYFNL